MPKHGHGPTRQAQLGACNHPLNDNSQYAVVCYLLRENRLQPCQYIGCTCLGLHVVQGHCRDHFVTCSLSLEPTTAGALRATGGALHLSPPSVSRPGPGPGPTAAAIFKVPRWTSCTRSTCPPASGRVTQVFGHWARHLCSPVHTGGQACSASLVVAAQLLLGMGPSLQAAPSAPVVRG